MNTVTIEINTEEIPTDGLSFEIPLPISVFGIRARQLSKKNVPKAKIKNLRKLQKKNNIFNEQLFRQKLRELLNMEKLLRKGELPVIHLIPALEDGMNDLTRLRKQVAKLIKHRK